MTKDREALEAEVVSMAHSVALTADGDFQQVESYVTVPVAKVREWLDRAAEIARGELEDGAED